MSRGLPPDAGRPAPRGPPPPPPGPRPPAGRDASRSDGRPEEVRAAGADLVVFEGVDVGPALVDRRVIMLGADESPPRRAVLSLDRDALDDVAAARQHATV